MAEPPVRTSNPRNTGDNEGNTANEASYVDGVLSHGGFEIRDQDVIAVVEIDGTSKILSLPPGKDSEHFGHLSVMAIPAPRSFPDSHQIDSLPPHILNATGIHIIVSTKSGVGLALEFADILRSILNEVGIPDSKYSVIETTSVESVKVFTRSTLLPEANKGQTQTVLLLSGDGGVVDIINGLAEAEQKSSSYVKPVISLFPLGTGNALFHSLHKLSNLPSIYIQGLRTLLHGSPRPLPTFRAAFSSGARLLTNEGQTATALKKNSLYGAVVASYGLHSTLVADSDTVEYRKHGDKRFGLAAKDLLFPEDKSWPHEYKADVVLNNGPLERKTHGYVLATLVSNLEKTFTISPESKPLDGKLRVVEFGGLSGADAMEVMKAAYDDGKHVDIEDVGYHEVESLRIEFKEEGESWKWRRCCVDGLIVAVELGGFMEVKLAKAGEEAVDVVVDL